MSWSREGLLYPRDRQKKFGYIVKKEYDYFFYEAEIFFSQKLQRKMERVGMEINQGDIYWLRPKEQKAIESNYPHPYVVIQDTVINHSRVRTVVVCALTSNIKKATEPGNVLLENGEANLAKQSVVVVSQVESVEKTDLAQYIGTLSKQRIEQIFAGMNFQQLSHFARFYQQDTY